MNQLEDEQGRRRRIPKAQRVCKICGLENENEEHLLLKCARYGDIREEWMEDIGVRRDMDPRKILKRMLGTGKWHFRWRTAGKHLKHMLERRSRLLERRQQLLHAVPNATTLPPGDTTCGITTSS